MNAQEADTRTREDIEEDNPIFRRASEELRSIGQPEAAAMVERVLTPLEIEYKRHRELRNHRSLWRRLYSAECNAGAAFAVFVMLYAGAVVIMMALIAVGWRPG